MGAYEYGVWITTVAFVIHHIQIGINIRDWNVIMTIIFFAASFMLWVVLNTNDNVSGAIVRGSTWSVLFRNG